MTMTWLPFFVKLFLIFVAGFVLLFVGNVGSIESLGNHRLVTVFSILQISGLVLALVSPVLMGLKFFARLDSKYK